MRLLRLEDDGEFSLVEFVGKSIPRYAVLSHTWGANDEEVTFKDIVKGTGKSKAGYSKIRFCAKQAANDGLQHFWMDTCSIDKSSSSELSEAINSMFSWYRKSSVCYAYLTDVDVDESTAIESEPVRRQIQESQWFTRGWTLQELLAPRKLLFFSKQGTNLGSKEENKCLVSEITGIHQRYLERWETIRTASVSERMSWMRNRITTRTEDIAYCLLGIFNIHMALLYGEGSGAFRRLQEEIIRVVNDQTIFCWSHRSPMVPGNWGSILAPHPAAFQGSMNFCRNQLSARDTMSYTFTNAGLSIQLPVIHAHQGIYAILDVSPDHGDHSSRLGIPLRLATDHGNYRRIRIPEDPVRIPTDFLRATPPRWIKEPSPEYPAHNEFLAETLNDPTTWPKGFRAIQAVNRENLYILFREDEDIEPYECDALSASISPSLQTQVQEVRCRLHITSDIPVYLSIPSTLKRSQSSAGNLRFSRKWSMVEARLNGANDSGAALLELHPIGAARPLEILGRFFCLLCVRLNSERHALWSISGFCLLGSAKEETAIKLQCQSSLPKGKISSSTSYNYIQRNPEVAFHRHDPPRPSIRDVDDIFHVELGRDDWKSRKIVVDELFQSMSAILRTCRREIDYLGQLTKNLEIQRKERR